MPKTAIATGPREREIEADRARLRIALVAGNYNYILDGVARSLNMLVAHLLERGHEVVVLAPTTAKPAFRHAGTLHSVPSIALPGRRGEYRLGLGLTPAARARLDRFRPDLVHIATPDLTGVTALNYAERRGIPAVASFHTRFDTYPRYYGAAWLEKPLTRYMRWLYTRCVHLYPPTPSMLDELRRARIGRELRLWRRGVDATLFNPSRRDMDWRRRLNLADDDVVVAFVGRIVREKGIDLFAEAVRRASARDPRVRGLIVGDGPQRPYFQSCLPEGVFVGFHTGEDLARAYASADIFFNPSLTETAGNVTLEAIAASLCCVGADAPGTRSYVTDGENGLLLPAGAGAEAYAEALLRLAGDADLRARMGAAGRARVCAGYSWPQVLDEVIDHYREAITAFHASKSSAENGKDSGIIAEKSA